VKAVTHYDNPEILAEVSRNLGEPMVGRNVFELEESERLAERGW
jgi:pyridoxal 5'-phosphate synthase pdxS subunit